MNHSKGFWNRRRAVITRAASALAAAILLLLLFGCACFNRDNRRLLNVMDDAIQPKSTAAKIALAPPGIVVGSLALAVDAFLVQPAVVIPKAADDIYQLFWKPRDMDFMRKAILFIPIVVLTPPCFVGDWFARSFFDINE